MILLQHNTAWSLPFIFSNKAIFLCEVSIRVCFQERMLECECVGVGKNVSLHESIVIESKSEYIGE